MAVKTAARISLVVFVFGFGAKNDANTYLLVGHIKMEEWVG